MNLSARMNSSLNFHASLNPSSASQVSWNGQGQNSSSDEVIQNIVKAPQIKSASLRSSMRRMRAEEQFSRSHFKADEQWLVEISVGDLEKDDGYERLLHLLDKGYFQRDEYKSEGDEFSRMFDLILNDRLAMFYAGLANRPEEGIEISVRRIESFRRFVQLLCNEYQSETEKGQTPVPGEREKILLILALLENRFESKSELAKGLNLLVMNDFEGAKQAFTAAGNRPDLTFDRILFLKILEQRLGQQFLSDEPFLIDNVPRNERALWLFRVGDYGGALKEIEDRKNDRFYHYEEYDREIRIFSYAFSGQVEESMGTWLEQPLVYYISGDKSKAKESLNHIPANYKNLATIAPFLLLMKAVELFEISRRPSPESTT